MPKTAVKLLEARLAIAFACLQHQDLVIDRLRAKNLRLARQLVRLKARKSKL